MLACFGVRFVGKSGNLGKVIFLIILCPSSTARIFATSWKDQGAILMFHSLLVVGTFDVMLAVVLDNDGM